MQICFNLFMNIKKNYVFFVQKKGIDMKIKIYLKSIFFIYNFNHSNFKNIYYNYHKIK
jgi:hypothetical protein